MSSSGSQVILTGMAPDTVAADRAIAVARGLAGDAVVNAMQVAPAQQVMLEVRFLEVSRSAARHLGVNWFGKGPGGGFNSGLPGNGPRRLTQAGPGPGGVPILSTTGTLVSSHCRAFRIRSGQRIQQWQIEPRRPGDGAGGKGAGPAARRTELDRAIRRHGTISRWRRISVPGGTAWHRAAFQPSQSNSRNSASNWRSFLPSYQGA